MTYAELDALTNDEYYRETGLCRTRYQAEKVKRNDPWYRGDEKIIHVEGGYKLMTVDEWQLWKMCAGYGIGGYPY